MRFFIALIFILPTLHAAPPIFSLKEVKPGLKGECRTVFTGSQIQSFQFEVMGVAKDFVGPGHDVIWCKMTSDPTGQKVVAAGMSGSPCYIDGRNVGALAYAWEFNKDPVFGVQPIESMLELLEFKDKEWSPHHPSLGLTTSQSMIQPPYVQFSAFFKTLAGFKRPSLTLSNNAAVQMIPLPLEISGLHPLIIDYVSRGLSEAGFIPQLTAGGGLSETPDTTDLLPGSPVTGVIATGDLNMAVTGTLTWRNDNKILAFGHPFLGVGTVNIPMGKAEIIGVVSSYLLSMKLSNKGKIVGTITQDRISAVSGTIGLMPKMTPMTVTIHRPDSVHTYQLEFCNNKFFTPMVYQIALLQFFSQGMERNEESTLKFKSDIQLEGVPSLHFEDVFAGEQFSWVFESVLSPSLQLMPLYKNDFDTPTIRKISVEAEILPVLQKATLKEITVQPLEARPGTTIHVRAGFQPWHGKRFYRNYDVPLPEEVKDGEVILMVADAQRMDQLLGNPVNVLSMNETSTSGSEPRKLEQLIDLLNQHHRHDQLYLVLQQKSKGLYLQNQRLTALPASIQKLLTHDQSADHPTPISEDILSKTQINFGMVVEGNRSVKIKIK